MNTRPKFLVLAGTLLLAGCELLEGTAEDQYNGPDWEFLFQDEGTRVCAYIDKASIHDNLSYRRAWVQLSTLPPSSPPNDGPVIETLFEFDCASGRQRTLQIEANRNNEQVYLENEQSEWERIDAHSANIYTFSIVCENNNRSSGVVNDPCEPPKLPNEPSKFSNEPPKKLPKFVPASRDGSADCDSVPLPELQRVNGWCS